MHAFLDGHELKPERPTLASGLGVGVRAAEAAGRIIVEAWVDGRPLSGEELENPSDVPGSVMKLELVSAEPSELVATTLLDGAAALDDLDATQRDAARSIQRGEVKEAIESIRRVVETWTSVRAIYDRGSAILARDLAEASPVPFGPMAEGLSTQLATLKDSLQRQDWSLLSDCLGYELTAQAKVWSESYRGMAKKISGGGNGGGGGS